MRQALWGLFKKVVIADTLAIYVDDIFNNYQQYPASMLLLGAVYFAFQIYCDFSGYSDIAIGTARLFGFDLMRNFAYPYFARDIAEFWRKWHISLSTWFRDYVYIPIGGSQGTKWRRMRNILVVFIVSGFWHGANWTFIVWGFLHGLFYLPLMWLDRHKEHVEVIAKGKLIPSFKEITLVITTFFMVVLSWVFFRAENINHALLYLGNLFQSSLFSIPNQARLGMFWISLLLVVEWVQREKAHPLAEIKLPAWARIGSYYLLIILIVIYHSNANTPFIYFQF